MTRHPLDPTVRGALTGALLFALAAAAYLVLNPSAEVPSGAVLRTSEILSALGVPPRVADSDLWEFVFNVALFIPLSALCALLWRGVPWWVWVGVGFATSVGIETFQLVFLDSRSPQGRDLVSNTLGSALGVGLALVVRRTHWWRRLHRPRARWG